DGRFGAAQQAFRRRFGEAFVFAFFVGFAFFDFETGAFAAFRLVFEFVVGRRCADERRAAGDGDGQRLRRLGQAEHGHQGQGGEEGGPPGEPDGGRFVAAHRGVLPSHASRSDRGGEPFSRATQSSRTPSRRSRPSFIGRAPPAPPGGPPPRRARGGGAARG